MHVFAKFFEDGLERRLEADIRPRARPSAAARKCRSKPAGHPLGERRAACSAKAATKAVRRRPLMWVKTPPPEQRGSLPRFACAAPPRFAARHIPEYFWENDSPAANALVVLEA